MSGAEPTLQTYITAASFARKARLVEALKRAHWLLYSEGNELYAADIAELQRLVQASPPA